MKEQEEYLERLVASKSFAELTAEELSFVLNELGSEERYNNLRQVSGFLDSGSPSTITPRSETIVSLKTRFNEHHSKQSFFARLLNAPVPAYAIVLALITVSVVTWFFTSSGTPKTITVFTPSPADTIRVATKADTVYITTVKYKYIKRKAEPVFTFVYPKRFEIQTDSSLSVTMKDKAELDNLLVTGVN